MFTTNSNLKKIVKSLLISSVLLLVGGVFYYHAFFGNKETVQITRLLWGVIDEDGDFDKSTKITFENKFIAWKADNQEEFTNSTQDILKKGRIPLITIEPWPFDGNKNNLLNDIYEGKYDDRIIQICEGFENENAEIWVRWGHEMDLGGQSRYPWAQNDARKYIKAYKHFVDKCRENTNNVKYVWSPAGKDGLEKFYPGDDYVDYVGLSLFAYPVWQEQVLGSRQDFKQMLDERYNRVKKYKKYIIISEMGVAGEEEYKNKWLSDGLELIKNTKNYPYLKGVAYFQATEVYNTWSGNVPAPNWKIQPSIFPGN